VDASGYRTEAEKGDGCYGWTGSSWKKDSIYNWKNLGYSHDDSHLVTCVSWNDSVAFARWLSDKNSANYRLPTEAEWEFAARSGGRSEKYSVSNDIDAVAWYGNNSGKTTHSIGQKQANGLGIYDMIGNVWEWCNDWYDDKYYQSSPRNNPQGPSSGSVRVLRGGYWSLEPGIGRASKRGWSYPVSRHNGVGFRLVLPQD
jgi:formylglycine-generating enzyme required for sulfatase activity